MTLKCPKCKTEIVKNEGIRSHLCPNCRTSLFYDGEELIPHYILPRTMNEDEGEKLFRDWLFNRGFRKDIEITKKEFLFFPFWLIKIKTPRETVQDIISPAAFSELTEINHLTFRGGELAEFSDEFTRGKEIRFPPDSFNQHYKTVLQKNMDKSFKMLEKSLLHLPVMFIQCRYQNMDYTGLIDVATGEVIIDVFPYRPRTYAPVVFLITVFLMSVLFSIELKYISNNFLRLSFFLGSGLIMYFLIKTIFIRL